MKNVLRLLDAIGHSAIGGPKPPEPLRYRDERYALLQCQEGGMQYGDCKRVFGPLPNTSVRVRGWQRQL